MTNTLTSTDMTDEARHEAHVHGHALNRLRDRFNAAMGAREPFVIQDHLEAALGEARADLAARAAQNAAFEKLREDQKRQWAEHRAQRELFRAKYPDLREAEDALVAAESAPWGVRATDRISNCRKRVREIESRIAADEKAAI